MATLKKSQKLVFKTNYRLMQVKRIAKCSMEQSAILLTFINLPFVIFVLSIFEWPFYTGFTVFLREHTLKFKVAHLPI